MRLSKRRRTAWSRLYGVLVAASTNTCFRSFPTPCICTKISVLMRRAASLSPDSPRAPHSESISSMKMIDGACSLAIVNSWFTSRSDSPIHLDTRSELETEKKVDLASVATALARYDLPVPGGPYRRNPDHAFLLPVKNCGNCTGRMTASLSASFAESNPATSDHWTFGVSVKMAPPNAPRSFCVSESTSPPPPAPAPAAPGWPPPPLGFAFCAAPPAGAAASSLLGPVAMMPLISSARLRYPMNFKRSVSFNRGFFSYLSCADRYSRPWVYSFSALS
mmetsp:Transcript_29112/g.95031  ORF Transcript_29112/g.95031 Transcript_29112/m.95031 type:complete len:278 (+) Transcript_29112:536-1369(+)